MDENPSARYKQTGCTGQTGYTVHILDEIIDKSVRQIFSKMRGIPKEQIITRRYEREVVERKNYLQTIQVERDKAQKDLISLKAEILACIKGESVLPKETLAEMITAQEEKLRELDALYESSYAETEKTAELMDNVSKLYEELISFSDLYDSASFEAKKMIVNQLMHILDEIIDKMVRQIFSRLRGIPKEQLITSRYAKETAERKNHLQALQAERDKAEKDLLALKTEILAVIKGESAFPKDTLAEMIAAQEKKHTELETLCEEASAELERNAELMANVSQLYEELISYADLYDSASFEAKKMIVSQLIRRVEVYRGYQIHVDFNFDLAQYLENSDELAC